MSYAIVSLNNEVYQPLADKTWRQNKLLYAQRHNYAAVCKSKDFYDVVIGFEKIWFIRDLLKNSDLEWIWWTGCDTLVTNMNIKIEDVVDNNYHFIIASDCNGLNADSFFVRNSPEGRAYIQMIIDHYPLYQHHGWAEQQVMIDTLDKYRDIIKILPQREINAYDYGLYPHCKPFDLFGNDGQWKKGDWHMHWPGTSLDHRLQLADYYLNEVVQ